MYADIFEAAAEFIDRRKTQSFAKAMVMAIHELEYEDPKFVYKEASDYLRNLYGPGIFDAWTFNQSRYGFYLWPAEQKGEMVWAFLFAAVYEE